jgi:membrane-associated phospholipid phosphatase
VTPETAVQLIELPVLVATFVLIAWLSVPRANPFTVALRPIRRIFTRKRYAAYVAAGALVVATNALLTPLDGPFTAAVRGWLGSDFTPFIHAAEGNVVALFQTWTPIALTWFLGWAYVIVFPVMAPCAMAVFDFMGQHRRNLALLAALVANYLIVLPFYMFFPVVESHHYRPPGGEPLVRLLLNDLDPAIIKVLRPMSGLDNCFPSFHTSLAVTVALFAWRSRRRAFRVVMTVLAACVVISTLYIGVHWVSDVLAGIVVGVVACRVGEWFANKVSLGTANAD